MVVPVKTLYFAEALYGYMPRPLFNLLEEAWLAGSPSVRVPDALLVELHEKAPHELWLDTLPHPRR